MPDVTARGVRLLNQQDQHIDVKDDLRLCAGCSYSDLPTPAPAFRAASEMPWDEPQAESSTQSDPRIFGQFLIGTLSATTQPFGARNPRAPQGSVCWAEPTCGDRYPEDKTMKREKYEKELREAPGPAVPPAAMGQGEGPSRRHRVRGTRRGRQGRDDPRHHRASQPARLPGGRPAGAIRPRKEPGLHAALPAALPRRPAKWSSSIGAGTTAPASST